MSTNESSNRIHRDWLPNELDRAGRENVDHAHVAGYDARMDSEAAEEIAILKELGLSSTSVVIDLGTGTGQFAVAAAASCKRVVAVDVSRVMLDALERKLVAQQIHNVEVVTAGFLKYEHRGPPADFIYTRFALHHLPDFWKAIALARMRETLREHGVLRLWDVVYSFEPQDADANLEAWCSASAAGWERREFEEHVRDEFSTFTWLLEPMLERVGFQVERAEYSPNGMEAKYIARAV